MTQQEREYYSIGEAAERLGCNRGTVYNRMALLNIKTHKFPQDKRSFISAADVQKIREVLDKPWRAEELKSKGDDAA